MLSVNVPRAAHKDWPTILLPEPGCFPPFLEGAPKERVLHVALKNSFEKQPGLEQMLRGISTQYDEIDWIELRNRGQSIRQAVWDKAKAIKPTLVFMQLQCAGVLTAQDIEGMRFVCDRDVVIVNWDGDQHHNPEDEARRWFVELGQACDTSLIVNTLHPSVYKKLGVRHPGYLQIGTDPRWSCAATPAAGTPPIVFLASNYPSHSRRNEIIHRLDKDLGTDFGVYGHGWDALQSGRKFLGQTQESCVYGAARAALSISIRNDLPRYSSDRLFRALASGSAVLVEAFPDTQGLGLFDGINCFIWKDYAELRKLIDQILRLPHIDLKQLRRRAADLACEHHMWSSRAGELLAIIDAIRKERHGRA